MPVGLKEFGKRSTKAVVIKQLGIYRLICQNRLNTLPAILGFYKEAYCHK